MSPHAGLLAADAGAGPTSLALRSQWFRAARDRNRSRHARLSIRPRPQQTTLGRWVGPLSQQAGVDHRHAGPGLKRPWAHAASL